MGQFSPHGHLLKGLNCRLNIMFFKNRSHCGSHCTMYSMVLKYNISCNTDFNNIEDKGHNDAQANDKFIHTTFLHAHVNQCFAKFTRFSFHMTIIRVNLSVTGTDSLRIL